MTTTVIREKLHDYIDIADSKKLEAIYSMIEDGVLENVGVWENEEFLNEFDRRFEELESGKVKGITLEELKAKF